VEVLEWYARLRLAEVVLDRIAADTWSGHLAQLRDRGVTHLILPADVEHPAKGVAKVYEDAHYRLYRLVDESTARPGSG
jgi:hypothetical protein